MKNQFNGHIVSGLGRGAKFLAMPVYSNIFRKELGGSPFLGTLNVIIPESHRSAIDAYMDNGKKYENLLNQEGKPTGGIIINKFRLIIDGTKLNCVGVRPILTSHDNSVIEIVAIENIRKRFDLNNNNELIVEYN